MKITTKADLKLIPILECFDPIKNVWRLRWDFRNGSFEEIEIRYKPTLDDIKKIIIDWYNKEISNEIIYGFRWKGMKVCLTKENQMNYMMFCDNDLSKHVKECLQIGWSKKDNIDWSAYEKIINS